MTTLGRWKHNLAGANWKHKLAAAAKEDKFSERLSMRLPMPVRERVRGSRIREAVGGPDELLDDAAVVGGVSGVVDDDEFRARPPVAEEDRQHEGG